MRLRFRCRTRTILVAIALLSLPLSYVTERWDRGGFAFQRKHRELAIYNWHEAGRCASLAGLLREHLAPGHVCRICRGPEKRRQFRSRIDALERQRREYERELEWHLLWVGSGFRWPEAWAEG